MWHTQTLLVILFAAFLQAQALNPSPPTIIRQPPTDELLYRVKEYLNGYDIPFTIECVAEGEPTPTYRWIKNGKEFNWQEHDERMVQQPTSGTIEITKPSDEDAGQYQCFAENEHGIATSNSVFVRKSDFNSFKDALPMYVTAIEAEPFTLQCQPPVSWPKPPIFWLIQKTDGSMKTVNNSRMTVDSVGNLHISTVILNDALDDSYYVCVETSTLRNEYKIGPRYVLGVQENDGRKLYPPRLQYVTPENELTLRGKTVELHCIYGGTPLPQTIWKKDGETISHWNEYKALGNYGKSLIIRNATFDDAGLYTCEVSNGVGNAQAHSINLQVNAVPYFTVEPDTQHAAEDENVEFKCEASGAPEPIIKWIHNGKPIEESPTNPRRRVSTNSIFISGLKSSDTANYGCNATNEWGYVYKDVYLNVL